MVERYKPDIAYSEPSRLSVATVLLSADDGEWVKYADYAALQQERVDAITAVRLFAQETVYHGNTVHHWYSKATAYKEALGKAWDALATLGVNSDGQTDLADMIAKLTRIRSEYELRTEMQKLKERNAILERLCDDYKVHLDAATTRAVQAEKKSQKLGDQKAALLKLISTCGQVIARAEEEMGEKLFNDTNMGARG